MMAIRALVQVDYMSELLLYFLSQYIIMLHYIYNI
jgi:hypothetical protein